MTRERVESSNIAAIGYDPETQVLEVEFKANRHGVRPVWEYFPVSEAVFDAMRDPALSTGRVFHAQIKNNPALTARLIEEIPESPAPAAVPT